MTSAVPINNPPPRDGVNSQQPPSDMSAQPAAVATVAPAAAPTAHGAPNAQNASGSPPLAPRIEQFKGWWKNLQLKQKGQHQDNTQGTDPLAELEVIPLSQSQRAMSFFHEDVERPAKLSRLRHLLGKGPSEHHHHHHHHHQLLASAHTSDGPFQPPPRVSGIFASSSSSFKRPDNEDYPAEHATESQNKGIFGVPLRESIPYANVAISLVDENGDSFIYGYVPIVVAKCGVFLKEKATGVEGIFRLSGSEKRIKELKTIFNSPDRYGKGLVWDGYTVHDAANVFRRYLNDLPEPVVPLELYEQFREPLKGATKKTVSDGDGPQFVEDFDLDEAIRKYQKLIMDLPPLNRQLLLYILDLLAVFAAKADENRMNSQNLAAVFSPGIISHPSHAMAPEEYRLNQCVLIFLIENQDHFLIGMQHPPETSQASSTTQLPSEVNATPSAAPQSADQASTAPAVAAPAGDATAPTGAENPESALKETVSTADTADADATSAAAEATSAPTAKSDVEPSAPAPGPSAPPASVPEPDPEKATATSAEEANGTANGLSGPASNPTPARKKLQKPRPVSQNPSAQSSQASLTTKG